VSSTFADLGVPAELSRLLKNRGITAPFPIQAATIPDALAGRDICGKAPTGSGKTLAFGLAIAARNAQAAPRRPRALVLVPTRELAAQVAGEIEALQTRRGQHVVAVYGGAGYAPQRRALSKGVATVVACPGRLEDLLAQGDVTLDDVDMVVLDEADRMADMGFMPAVKRILDQTSPTRQTLLFSATLDGEIDALVRRYQHDPARHEVRRTEDEIGDVEHLFWRAAPAQRAGVTAALVHRHGRAIVFCRTKRGADRLAKQLGTAGVDAAAIHGNRSQAQRERALSAFATGRVNALVATDVAARGIHVDDVACVVHFDLPADPKDYVHRSGRTGRAGATGTVVSLVTDDLRKAARLLQRSLGLPQELTAPGVTDADMPPARAADAPTGTPDWDRPAQHRARARGATSATGGPRRRKPRQTSRDRTSSEFRGSRSGGGAGGSDSRGKQGSGTARPGANGSGSGNANPSRRKRRPAAEGGHSRPQRSGSPSRSHSGAGSSRGRS
jgi:superfamily II DNA/RNA helicase